ncbi:MAG: SGNH/GDSL hydrolase family protein [Eubacterium sp.]|nr:SGNH/GDSL hydrolase family protein [Eubacterium sp.]
MDITKRNITKLLYIIIILLGILIAWNCCITVWCVEKRDFFETQIESVPDDTNSVLEPRYLTVNHLYRKTALFVGDSIIIGQGTGEVAEGDSRFDESEKYITWYSRKTAPTAARYISEWNDMNVYNYAVCGSTIANVASEYPNAPDETFLQLFPDYAGRTDNWVISQLQRYKADMDAEIVPKPDYIIIEGGANDIMKPSVEIGQVSTQEAGDMIFNHMNNKYHVQPFTADKQTTVGAFEELIYYVYKNFRGSKVGFMSTYPLRKYSYAESEERWIALENACNKWGVPYLDVFHELGVGLYVSTITGESDIYNVNIHPDATFNKTVYAPKIEAWMRTL